MEILSTERLILRRWQPSDRRPFAAINADPRVMEFLGRQLSSVESDRLVDRIETSFAERGFGLCAVELRASHSFIGFIGLSVPNFQASFTPCVEIGWRLAAEAWGMGLATEGARAMAHYAFEALCLPLLVSFTAVQNVRSRRVMEKIGMTFDPSECFDHPHLPDGHPSRQHVLYRLRAGQQTNP
jgi:RimJ/RimL family protein N-acetyltransferase